MVVTSKDPLVGVSLGEYNIRKMVGKGGMSRVYLAVDEHLSRDVAIKVITLDPDRAKELMKRFEREAKTIGKLDRHPNIIRVHRYGTEGETRYLAMEFIHGDTLTQRMARYKNQGEHMPYAELIHIMQQVASALDYAHQHHVVHRDVKPSNIMIEEDTNRAVLMDFGLVMQSNSETTLGTAFGTPRYISPEQAISSQQAVPQSDIYSLAVIIYEILAGQTPFDDESAMSLALSHITNPAPDPREFRDVLPAAVSDVLLKALEKNPLDRYRTATEMIDALAEALNITMESTINQPTATGSMPVVKSLSNLDEDEPDTVNGDVTPDVLPPYTEPKASSTKSRSQRMVFGFIGLVIVVFAIMAVMALGGDDGNQEQTAVSNDQESSIQNAQVRRQMVLKYTNDYLTVYNQSSRNLDIRGLEFVLPNGEKRFIAEVFGATTLENFEPKRCVYIGLVSVEVTLPDFCAEDTTRILRYNNQTSDPRLYWVWLREDGGNSEFNVVLQGDVIATCSTQANRCAFDIPS